MGATMIYVTHDQVEAMTLADKIVVLNAGRVEQVGTPLELYHRPKNLFVAGFIGSPQMNFIETEVLDAGGGGVRVALPGGGSVVARVAGSGLAKGEKVKLGIRPEHLAESRGEGELSGDVDVVEELGESHFLYVRTSDGRVVTVRAQGDAPVRARTKIAIGVPGEACHIFRADGMALPRLN
jgi:multiple sugar transport system ATP-binding protein